MKLRTFKTFDIGYIGVQIALGMYALFLLGITFGIRGLIIIEQPVIPAVAAMAGAFLGASYYMFVYFYARYCYAKTVLFTTPMGFSFTMGLSHPRRAEIASSAGVYHLTLALAATVEFWKRVFPAKAAEIDNLVNGGSCHIHDRAPRILLTGKFLETSADLKLVAKMTLDKKKSYFKELSDKLDPDADGFVEVRGLCQFARSVVMFKDNSFDDMIKLVRHEVGHTCLYGAGVADSEHHSVMESSRFGY